MSPSTTHVSAHRKHVSQASSVNFRGWFPCAVRDSRWLDVADPCLLAQGVGILSPRYLHPFPCILRCDIEMRSPRAVATSLDDRGRE